MSRARYEVACPGCGRRLTATSEDKRRARVLTHVRNCNAFKAIGVTAGESEAAELSAR